MVAIPINGPVPRRQPSELTTLQLMKLARRWMVWHFGPISIPGKKPPKKPFYVNGRPRGTTDTLEDLEQLSSYEAAKAVVDKGGGKWHLGFALGADGGGGCWQGVDFDNTLEGMNGSPGYVEKSPSGAGFHVIGYGRAFLNKADHDSGVEWYSYGRFFTFTGDIVSDGPPADLYEQAGTGDPPEHDGAAYDRPVETLEDVQIRDIKAALRYLDPDPYHTWVSVALALQKVEGGLDVFLEWSRGSGKHKDSEATHKFQNVGLPYAPWRSIFNWAKEAGWDPREKPGFDLGERVIPVDFSQPRPIEFVMDGFVAAGTVIVAGTSGVGKSSILMGMALTVAHLCKVEGLTPPYLRRRVYFITEDPDQVQRIIRGMNLRKQLTVSLPEFNEWFKLVPSNRTAPEAWRKALAGMMTAEEKDPYIRLDAAFRPAPLVVFDTIPSNLELENENDNAVVSAAVAAIRAGAGRASIWAVMHVAKAQKYSEAEEMSARGAGAWGADTQGEIFIFYPPKEDPDDPPPQRRLVQLGKRRFEAEHVLYEVGTEVSEEQVDTPWGQEQRVLYRTVSDFQPKTLEERSDEKKARKSNRSEADEQGLIMTCVARFKKALAATQSLGLAVSHARGAQPPVPGGWQKYTWDELMRGVIGKGAGMRPKIVEAILTAFKPDDTGAYYLFTKPSFGMGTTTAEIEAQPEA